MKTILIVGGTGFLGRNLSKMLWKKYKNKFKIITTGVSPNKINQFKTTRRNWGATEVDIPCQCIDIIYDIDKLDMLFKNNNINYVIHCAALKYIDIAEKDPLKCIDINIIGTKNILALCNKYNIENLIALSTDKANTPINTYGMSKYLMEQIVLQYNYSIYQGVNFFWSDGSVLDIWYRQIRKKEKLCITDLNQDRYYSIVDDICNDIINNIDVKGKIIFPTNIFKIKLKDLYEAMITKFEYDKNSSYYIGYRTNEKQIEELNINQKNNTTSQYTIKDIIEIINYTLEYTDISSL